MISSRPFWEYKVIEIEHSMSHYRTCDVELFAIQHHSAAFLQKDKKIKQFFTKRFYAIYFISVASTQYEDKVIYYNQTSFGEIGSHTYLYEIVLPMLPPSSHEPYRAATIVLTLRHAYDVIANG